MRSAWYILDWRDNNGDGLLVTRAMQLMAVVCAASLIGNAWLYRELRVQEWAEPPRAAPALPQIQDAVPKVSAVAATLPAVSTADLSKTTTKQALDKCRKKFEDQTLRQLRDPKEREGLKRQEMIALQAMNAGAATRLHVSEQVINRIFELQAEQDLAERESSIGGPRSPKAGTVNPQIANEFGEAVATKWADYSREYSGRMAVQAIANLFADADAPLTEEQRRRLASVYADEFEFQNSQDPGPDMQELQGDGNPRAMANWFQKQVAQKQALEQRVQAAAASFLTPVQLELLRKRSELEAERARSLVESMPKTEGNVPMSEVEC